MRTQRDIQRDQATNDLRKALVDAFEKYSELEPMDSLIVLSELIRSEVYIVNTHVDALEGNKE